MVVNTTNSATTNITLTPLSQTALDAQVNALIASKGGGGVALEGSAKQHPDGSVEFKVKVTLGTKDRVITVRTQEKVATDFLLKTANQAAAETWFESLIPMMHQMTLEQSVDVIHYDSTSHSMSLTRNGETHSYTLTQEGMQLVNLIESKGTGAAAFKDLDSKLKTATDERQALEKTKVAWRKGAKLEKIDKKIHHLNTQRTRLENYAKTENTAIVKTIATAHAAVAHSGALPSFLDPTAENILRAQQLDDTDNQKMIEALDPNTIFTPGNEKSIAYLDVKQIGFLQPAPANVKVSDFTLVVEHYREQNLDDKEIVDRLKELAAYTGQKLDSKAIAKLLKHKSKISTSSKTLPTPQPPQTATTSTQNIKASTSPPSKQKSSTSWFMDNLVDFFSWATWPWQP